MATDWARSRRGRRLLGCAGPRHAGTTRSGPFELPGPSACAGAAGCYPYVARLAMLSVVPCEKDIADTARCARLQDLQPTSSNAPRTLHCLTPLRLAASPQCTHNSIPAQAAYSHPQLRCTPLLFPTRHTSSSCVTQLPIASCPDTRTRAPLRGCWPFAAPPTRSTPYVPPTPLRVLHASPSQLSHGPAALVAAGPQLVVTLQLRQEARHLRTPGPGTRAASAAGHSVPQRT
jgi:hypothetical protein